MTFELDLYHEGNMLELREQVSGMVYTRIVQVVPRQLERRGSISYDCAIALQEPRLHRSVEMG